MNSFPKIITLTLALVLAVFTTCKDQWEEHNALKQNVLSEHLGQLIKSNPSLSDFAGYLAQTGYDKILTSSKTFTVWAPDNNALSNLDPNITNDLSKLTQFVENHISYQEYPVNSGSLNVKIKMLSGKILQYSGNEKRIEGRDIALDNSNQYCLNGILHIIHEPLYPKKSLWEYFTGITDTSMSLQKSFIHTALERKVFDAGLSTRTGYNAKGEPIYDSVWVDRNLFLYEINNINSEDSVFTFFILKNNAFRDEYNKLLPYVNDTTPNATENMDFYAKWDLVKDVVARGKYTGNLPPFLVSTQGIVIPTSNITIDDQYEASNGMVYIVSRFDIPKENKISSIIIEGENYKGTYNGSFAYQGIPLLGIRSRSWASGGRDLFIPGTNGPGIAYLSVRYNTPNLYSVSYLVYWRAVNDFQSSNFSQKLAINADSIDNIKATTYRGDTLVKFKTIIPNNYNEVLLGQFTVNQFGSFRLYVVAGTTLTNNPIVLDYLKLVPVFQ